MKARNREVNIFNMSLLDILCGALGAFCFMMLSLLPYYRPPGKDINISKEQKELLDEVQKIKDLAERLKNTSRAEDLTELVKMLREQITRLENEIKKLQGELNMLYAENEELKKRIEPLEKEIARLRERNQFLEQEHERLLARNKELEQRNQQLQREKQQLEQEKQKVENYLRRRVPWTVTVSASDPRALLDCSLHEVAVTADDEKKTRQADFDPNLLVQPALWTGDYRFDTPGSVTRVNADRVIGGEEKFYIKVNSTPAGSEAGPLHVEVNGTDLAPVSIAPFIIPAPHKWIFLGRFRVTALNRITFTGATLAEREEEWARIDKVIAEKKAKPTPDPNAPDDRTGFGPGFARRRKEYEAMTANAPKEVKEALLIKWEAEAESDRERVYVRGLRARLANEQPGGGFGERGRRGLSSREEAIEEMRKRGDHQNSPPQPGPNQQTPPSPKFPFPAPQPSPQQK